MIFLTIILACILYKMSAPWWLYLILIAFALLGTGDD
jgi:hypothetical protein